MIILIEYLVQNLLKIIKIIGKKSELIEEYELKEGKNNVQIIIKNKLINFNGAISLVNIEELKYLNTETINNFTRMFSFCKSLTDIKSLQNWNISNGNNFSDMFSFCKSLTDIKPLQN